MKTMTRHEVRPLTAKELDAVTGGKSMSAVFKGGGVTVEIYVDEHTYTVNATSGSGYNYEITQH